MARSPPGLTEDKNRADWSRREYHISAADDKPQIHFDLTEPTLLMTRRYYVPEIPAEGGILALPEDEALHAAKVMRVQVGDAVVLFSGDDHQCEGQVTSVDRKRVFVAVTPPRPVSRELGFPITVAVAMPKGDRMRIMIEKLTELGVARVVPLVTARTQAAPSSSAIDKLRRAVIEASKQCERNRLMEIAAPLTQDAYLDQHAARVVGGPVALDLIAHPDGHSFVATIAGNTFDEANLMIGPEGGFTAEEVETAVDRGWQRVALGPIILRVETAAIAAVARLALA